MASTSDEDRRIRVAAMLHTLSKINSEIEKEELKVKEMQAELDAAMEKNPAVNPTLPAWKEREWIKAQMEETRKLKERFDEAIRAAEEFNDNNTTTKIREVAEALAALDDNMEMKKSNVSEGDSNKI